MDGTWSDYMGVVWVFVPYAVDFRGLGQLGEKLRLFVSQFESDWGFICDDTLSFPIHSNSIIFNYSSYFIFNL